MGPKFEHDLDLLSAVERGETQSQAMLSHRLGFAVGLVNALLKRAVRKGYVKIRSAPARRYAYYLTPKGLSEKSRLVGAYLHHSLSIFRQAREEYLDLLLRAAQTGRSRVVFVGCGELAEIALLAAAEARVEALAIVAVNEIKADRFMGLRIYASIDDIAHDFDAVLLTSYDRAQESYDALIERLGADRVLAPRLLRIIATPEPGAVRNRRVGA